MLEAIRTPLTLPKFCLSKENQKCLTTCWYFSSVLFKLKWKQCGYDMKVSCHLNLLCLREKCTIFSFFFFFFTIYLIVLTFQPIVLIRHYSAWSIISCLVIYKIPARGKSFMFYCFSWEIFFLYQSIFLFIRKTKKKKKRHSLEAYNFIC